MRLLVVLWVLAGLPLAAEAQTDDHYGGLPLALARRPLTLSEHTIRFDGSAVFHQTRDEAGPEQDPLVGARAGIAYGLGESFEIGGLGVVRVAPDTEFGLQTRLPTAYREQPNAYVRGRGAFGDLELGADMHAFFETESGTFFTLEPAGLLRMHFGDMVRLDSGAYFPVTFDDSAELLGIRIPIELTFNFHSQFFGGVGGEIFLIDVDPDKAIIPGKVFLGGTAMAEHGGPLLDIAVNFQFPMLFLPNNRNEPQFGAFDFEEFNTSPWEVNLQASVYWDLLR